MFETWIEFDCDMLIYCLLESEKSSEGKVSIYSKMSVERDTDGEFSGEILRWSDFLSLVWADFRHQSDLLETANERLQLLNVGLPLRHNI